MTRSALRPADRPTHLQIARALRSGLRARILVCLVDRVASPAELARTLGEPLNKISYHVGVLRESGCVELVRTTQRRGAVVHHYGAVARPYLTNDEWDQLPAALKRELTAGTLRDILQEARASAARGGFDRPDAHLNRIELELNAEGWREV